MWFLKEIVFLSCVLSLHAAVPENLVVEGVPEITQEMKADVGRYLEFRSAAFQSWHPQRREMLITTRFAETMQVHVVGVPGGARRQLTFLTEPVSRASWQPGLGGCFVFAQDTGGGESFQLYRFDAADGRITLLTDGKSRNTGAVWSLDGKQLAFTSTARNGRDNDVWVMDPARPDSRKMLAQLEGGGWQLTDWSADGKWLALGEYKSANNSAFWLMNADTGNREILTPPADKEVAREGGLFSRDGKHLFLTSDEGGEFRKLGRLSLADRKFEALAADIPWDVESLALSPDGSRLAFSANEDGASVLRVLTLADNKLVAFPTPAGVIGGLEWHSNGVDLGFSLTSARSPADAWSVDTVTGQLTRWTESETGGLNAAGFVEPEKVRLKSFDGVAVSGFLYRPDPARFPGRRPVIINIHGGPEGQSRPIFQARNNYLMNELGVAILYPNVRGSEGYGKTFLAMDNGMKRKNSVKDIGALLDFIAADASLDAGRTAVTGGSYGGYMTLACMVDFGDRFRAGCDIVGISNFLTFLKNTSDYRRDLRRVEYGDERDPAMAEFLNSISPSNHAAAIRRPLFIVQGQNDPRVPVTEAEQMVKAVRAAGAPVWYLMAKDEGHGFGKKRNMDYQFMATMEFWRKYLLE